MVVEARPDDENIELFEHIPVSDALVLGSEDNPSSLKDGLPLGLLSADQATRKPTTVHITTPKVKTLYPPSPRTPNLPLQVTPRPLFSLTQTSQNHFQPSQAAQDLFQPSPTAHALFQPLPSAQSLFQHAPRAQVPSLGLSPNPRKQLQLAPTPGVWAWQHDTPPRPASFSTGVDFNPPLSGWSR